MIDYDMNDALAIIERLQTTIESIQNQITTLNDRLDVIQEFIDGCFDENSLL